MITNITHDFMMLDGESLEVHIHSWETSFSLLLMPSHHHYCTMCSSQFSHLFFHSAQKQIPLFMTQHEQSTDWLKCPAMRSVIGCSPCSCVGHADQECQKPQEEVCFFYGAAVTVSLLSPIIFSWRNVG